LQLTTLLLDAAGSLLHFEPKALLQSLLHFAAAILGYVKMELLASPVSQRSRSAA